MAKYKKRSAANTRSSKKPRKSFLRRLVWWAVIWSVVLAGVAVLVLDGFVRAKFEGAKWELPAHVYSRSLDLYQGLNMSANRLRWELDKLGYRAVSTVSSPGQYREKGSQLELYTRPFNFWDGDEPARHLTLNFDGSGINEISSRQGELDLVRLEPMLIGGIYPEHSEDRVLVKLSDMPPKMINGLLAVEDRNFYDHFGISFKGIARALISNLRAGDAVQGGSTITQQLVKNFYLTQERSLFRKGVEAIMAILLEIHYSKDEILETYVNEVFLGQSGKRAIHGFGLASRHYFRQPIGELEPHQYALLIGMVKGASYYEPWRNKDRATARRNLVLNEMLELGIISHTTAESAKRLELDLASKPGTSSNPYPAYLELVKNQLDRDYREEDLQSAGLRIFTHFDPQAQRQVESSISSVVEHLEAGYKIKPGALESAAVIVRIGTADVLALAGGRNPGYAGYNRALDAKRQIGSTVKPAVYLAALERPETYTLGTLVDDGPVTVKLPTGKVWQPKNYERESHGRVPLYEALAQSYNQATARLGMQVGISPVAEAIRRLGYEGSIQEVPSLFLGSLAMSPMDVASMYHTIASEGFYTPLRTISAVYTEDNKPLKHYPFSTEQRFSPKAMYLLHFAMQSVMKEGTGKSAYRRLRDGMTVAGKTGTTNDQRDSWFSGFSGDYVGVVWVGRDDNDKMPLTGATGALQIWSDIMAGLETRSMPYIKPEGVSYQWIEIATGRLSTEGCAGTRYLPYLDGSEPKERSACYRSSADSFIDAGRGVIDRIKGIFGND